MVRAVEWERVAIVPLLLGVAAPHADAPRYPPDSVLLLVAPWYAMWRRMPEAYR